jgi:hypothetical protein
LGFNGCISIDKFFCGEFDVVLQIQIDLAPPLINVGKIAIADYNAGVARAAKPAQAIQHRNSRRGAERSFHFFDFGDFLRSGNFYH